MHFVGEKWRNVLRTAVPSHASEVLIPAYFVPSSASRYGACLTFSWVTFVRQRGVSPLASGQWPAFLAFYAGVWTIQNFARPAR